HPDLSWLFRVLFSHRAAPKPVISTGAAPLFPARARLSQMLSSRPEEPGFFLHAVFARGATERRDLSSIYDSRVANKAPQLFTLSESEGRSLFALTMCASRLLFKF